MSRRRAHATRTAALAAAFALALTAAPAFAQQSAPQEPPRPPAEVPSSTEQQPAAAFADPNAAAPAPNFEARWLDTLRAVTAHAANDEPRKRRGSKEPPGITILQLGDSHTAADFFTGELRKRLQAVFGNGGAGYMAAGRPHLGVRSSTFKITVSSGWTYKSLFKTNDPAEFWLSGYNAIATEAGQTIALESETAVPFDSIEIETVRQPGGGSIDIKLDGKVESHYDLKADTIEPIVIRLNPGNGTSDKVRQIAITTTTAGTVNIASISSFNRRAGLTYSAVGFPGAQINLVDKFDDRVLASELSRIAPQIVVLAFGTNEGFRDDLDLESYGKIYERVVTRIQATLPGATIVVVAPPAGAQKEGGECGRTPAALQRVRDVQEDIAKRHKLVYWNWASIMPEECGAHKWATMSPPLMAKDHVHLSIDGYKKSAAEFLNTLIPIIRELRARSNVVSNN